MADIPTRRPVAAIPIVPLPMRNRPRGRDHPSATVSERLLLSLPFSSVLLVGETSRLTRGTVTVCRLQLRVFGFRVCIFLLFSLSLALAWFWSRSMGICACLTKTGLFHSVHKNSRWRIVVGSVLIAVVWGFGCLG